MSLPCPMCSAVIYGEIPKGIFETPSWRWAKNSSAKEGRMLFHWTGCRHAIEAVPKEMVRNERRALVETQWDEAAKKLFEARTFGWKPEHRVAFGKPLGFIK